MNTDKVRTLNTMRAAARAGFDPYNSQPAMAKAFATRYAEPRAPRNDREAHSAIRYTFNGSLSRSGSRI